MRRKVAVATNELIMLFIPFIILTKIISISGVGASIQVSSVLSLVLPSCFIVLSLYLPMNYNHVVNFRAAVSYSRRNNESQEIGLEEEDIILKRHRTSAKFILRSGLLALGLFTYPVISNIKNSDVEQISDFAYNNSILIDSSYISASILISVYISYLVLSLSMRYLRYSDSSESSAINGYLSMKTAVVIVSILELISLFGLLSTTSSLESGVWFASSIIGSVIIVVFALFLQ